MPIREWCRASRPGPKLLVCACVLAFVVGAEPATASVGSVVVWPGSVVTYRDSTRGHRFHGAVTAAVAAWNRLHLGVKLKPVNGAADVRISQRHGGCLRGRAGVAPLGFRSSGSRIVIRHVCPVIVLPLLIAHELGRALGLPVDDSRCSLMNSHAVSDGLTYVVPRKCPRRHRPRWIRDLIDPATAARARLMYTPPLAPGAIDLSVNGAGVPEVSWIQPSDATAVTTVIARTAGVCPTDRSVAAGTVAPVFDAPAVAGAHVVVDSNFPRTGGPECYRAFDLNRFGRAADSPDAISYMFGGPIAGFTVSGVPVAGTATAFTDSSTATHGSISRWSWDFGDPASGTKNILDTSDPAVGRTPSHVYGEPGTYDATLTVSDSSGLTSSIVEEIAVRAAS